MDATSGAGTTNPSGTPEFRVYERGVPVGTFVQDPEGKKGPVDF
jgi:hypothetical protein